MKQLFCALLCLSLLPARAFLTNAVAPQLLAESAVVCLATNCPVIRLGKVVVYPETGRVEVPDDADLDAASRKFWEFVRRNGR